MGAQHKTLHLTEVEIVTAMAALADKVKTLDTSGDKSPGVIEERSLAERLRIKLANV